MSTKIPCADIGWAVQTLQTVVVLLAHFNKYYETITDIFLFICWFTGYILVEKSGRWGEKSGLCGEDVQFILQKL